MRVVLVFPILLPLLLAVSGCGDRDNDERRPTVSQQRDGDRDRDRRRGDRDD